MGQALFRILAVAALALVAAHAGAQAVWTRTITGPAGASATLGDGVLITRSMAADAAGNVVLAGTTATGTDSDMLVTSLAAADGAQRWQRVISGRAGGNDVGYSVAMDGAGNAIVAGVRSGAGTDDIYVAKLAAATGATLWERSLGPGTAYFVAVDGANDPVLAAEITGAGGTRDVRVIKLAGASGATAWTRDFDGGRDDYASEIALDSSGNVVLLAVSTNAAGDDDIQVLKYAGAGGTLVWQRPIDGGGPDQAVALAVGSAGNVVVAGFMESGGNRDFYTAKLDGSSGAILWQQRRDGGGADQAQSVALDSAGDVIVTGISEVAAGRTAFRTIKYSGTSGAIAWEKAADAGVSERAYQVVMDPSGNVVASGSTSAAGQADWKSVAYTGAGALLYQDGYGGAAGADDQAIASVRAGDGVVVAGPAYAVAGVGQVRAVKLRYATLDAAAVSSLVTHFYQSILRRAPDAPGLAFWSAEPVRLASYGASPTEAFHAMAMAFFNGPEYAAFRRDDAGFVTDLYANFLDRAPDGSGLSFWTGQLAAGLPREVALAAFMFAPEYGVYVQSKIGAVGARPESDAVMDFYRGLLARLPDAGGYDYWVKQFRAAQCAGAGAVYTQAESISSAFANGGEYAARGRSNAQYVGDLYNAFLRRGGDLTGVRFWIERLDAGALTRDAVRREFIASPEFSARVNAIVSQGCAQ